MCDKRTQKQEFGRDQDLEHPFQLVGRRRKNFEDDPATVASLDSARLVEQQCAEGAKSLKGDENDVNSIADCSSFTAATVNAKVDWCGSCQRSSESRISEHNTDLHHQQPGPSP